jgi:hypothetical protein
MINPILFMLASLYKTKRKGNYNGSWGRKQMMGRWGNGKLGKWGNGELGKWGDGEMGYLGNGRASNRVLR